MEHSLSCNNLKCRSPLGQRALVTTCSHIFCLECAHQLGITRGEQGKRPSCPACKSELPTPEDAIITNLNPSEEYKTSILSGLSPNIVMECAGRALSFWAYQTTQDIYYHQHLYRTLTEKYSNLHQHLEKTMNDANSHIENLHDKMTEMTAEQDGLRRKVEDISQAYKEKSKRLLQVQELYDKVKRKAEMGHIERAASEAVASTLHTTARQTNESQGGVGYGRNAITGHEGSSFFRMAHLGLPGNTPVVGSSRVEHTRPDSEEQWLEPRLRRQASSSTPARGGTVRRKIGSTTLVDGHNFPGYAGPAVLGRNTGQNGQLSAPGFSNNQSTLSGIGLTSGLKVSNNPSISGLDASSRHF